ncbi:circumsporozoite protein [Homalodisca vitripennis]|nr:circumsporozoite protein [Homalodisca vitripennis]
MLRIVLLSALAALGAAQQQYTKDSRNAAIIADQRYLKIGGEFGSAYQQEDGVQFKEESDADGTRRGQYSYVDPNGQVRTVSYVAGKNGFQPVGDHLPTVPQPVVNPQPQYNPPPQQQYNPAPQQQYNPAPQQQYNPAPQQQYNTAPQQFNNPSEDNGQWVDDTAVQYPANSPATYNNPAPAPQPQPQPSWNANPQWNAAPQAAPVYTPTTTPAPHRFYPPGKLSLNRSPDGFSYTFNKA